MIDKFEKLLLEQVPRLHRYAQVLTKNTEQVDDLVQDSLERAWRYKNSWQGGTNLRAWLFTIMHNAYVNQIRKLKNIPETMSLDNIEPVSELPSQESVLRMEDLMSAINELQDEQREVMLLVCVETLKYDEVATICNIPIGTVTSRLYRAREQIRLKLSAPSTSQSGRVIKRVK